LRREPGIRWPARLALTARGGGGSTPTTTRVHAEHEGPLRLLKTLYPEGPGVAHAVVVHPPGGLVGGDRLDISLDVQPGAHLLATTPAATRYYRSVQGEAVQAVHAHVAPGARLEWLPQETLAYRGCLGRNELRVQLQGQLIASELLALGLREAHLPFDHGALLQHLEIEGLWLDRGWLRADDRALLDGPCGLAGHRALGTLVMAQAEPFEAGLAEGLLDDARSAIADSGLTAGATLLQGRLAVLRVLAHELEAPTALIRRVRGAWRERTWGLALHEPRIWAT
jgi:urease accessory protein